MFSGVLALWQSTAQHKLTPEYRPEGDLTVPGWHWLCAPTSSGSLCIDPFQRTQGQHVVEGSKRGGQKYLTTTMRPEIRVWGQASPVTAPAPCKIGHPQTRPAADRVPGFALFCTLTANKPPNQVRFRYVHLASYGFLQTPPLANDALASRIVFPSVGVTPPSLRWPGLPASPGKQKWPALGRPLRTTPLLDAKRECCHML